MNIDEFTLALIKMGYRRPDKTIDPNRWAKPIGYNIFIVFVKEAKISCHFYGVDSQLHCWSSKEIVMNDKNRSIEAQLCEYEQYADGGGHHLQKFGFLSREDHANIMTGDI